MVAQIAPVPMTLEDVEECTLLDKRCFSDGEAYDLDTFSYLLASPLVVAHKVHAMNGTMTGFVIGMLEPGAVGHVISVGVAPEYRRMGFAQMLMESVEHGFVERDATISRLEVRATNQAAQKLYLKLGYGIAQRLSRYYTNGDDALLMVKSLSIRTSFSRYRL
ncbi:MAG: GNAT family N-acetyltransferase [Acidobacteria bacterium]|nr:GNAT family N-acetyltransferase [Acidobacteriota bacterium]